MASLFKATPQLLNFRTNTLIPNYLSSPILHYPSPSYPLICALKTASDGERVESHELLRKPVVSAAEDDDDEEEQEVEEEEEERESEEREGSDAKWVDWEDQILEDTVPLVGFVRMILHSKRYGSGERLSPEHEKTILERLLPHHPAYENKIGCGVDYITVGYHPDFETSRCLFIVRKDGEMVDFSYWKCIKGLIKKNYPLYADSFILRHFRKHKRNV